MKKHSVDKVGQGDEVEAVAVAAAEVTTIIAQIRSAREEIMIEISQETEVGVEVGAEVGAEVETVVELGIRAETGIETKGGCGAGAELEAEAIVESGRQGTGLIGGIGAGVRAEVEVATGGDDMKSLTVTKLGSSES
jgi:hypothetical protein